MNSFLTRILAFGLRVSAGASHRFQTLPLARLSALLLALLLAACTSRTQEVLPLSRSIIGASQVKTIELVIQPSARASIAAMDERATRSKDVGYEAAPVAQLLPDMIREATRKLGLTSGRELKLILEIDEFDTAGTGSALVGGKDRLAGTVFVRDAAKDEPLGQLYVDVSSRNSGLMGLATRGGVRERTAEAFAMRIAKALSGK